MDAVVAPSACRHLHPQGAIATAAALATGSFRIRSARLLPPQQ